MLVIALMSALVLVLIAGPALRFNDRVTLPNGFVLKRQFNFTRYGRHDLFAANGTDTLSKNIEFVCFDDRFVQAISKDRSQTGLFDATTQTRVSPKNHPEIYQGDGLKSTRVACNGYYTGMIGPSFLYEASRSPNPQCAWVNHENPALQNDLWMARPCR